MHTSFLMDPIDRVSPRGIKVDPYSCFYLNTFCIVFSHTEEQYASSEQKQRTKTKKNLQQLFSKMNFLNCVQMSLRTRKPLKVYGSFCSFLLLLCSKLGVSSNVKYAYCKSWEGALVITFYFLINRLHFLEQFRFINKLNRKQSSHIFPPLPLSPSFLLLYPCNNL